MRAYGLKPKDRVTCCLKWCNCGDMSSKHPRRAKKYSISKRLKKSARQEGKIHGLYVPSN